MREKKPNHHLNVSIMFDCLPLLIELQAREEGRGKITCHRGGVGGPLRDLSLEGLSHRSSE